MIGTAVAGLDDRHLAIPTIDVLAGLLFHYDSSVLRFGGVVMVAGIARPIAAAAAAARKSLRIIVSSRR